MAGSLTTIKLCSRCGHERPLDQFSMVKGRPGTPRRPASWCKQCNRESAAAWREANPDKKRQQNRDRQRDPAATTRYRRKWQRSEAGKAAARRYHLKGKYGLSEVDFAAMVKGQAGKCALCECTPAQLVVDHDHDTGRVRALLCDPCNRGLAVFRDNATAMGRAADYVRVWREV